MPRFSRPAAGLPPPRRRSRHVLVAALVALAVLAGACSGGGDDDGRDGAGGTQGTGAEPPTYAFTVTGAEVQAMTPTAPAFPDDVMAAVKAALDAYLGTAVVEPLRGGKPPTGFEGTFTAGALARLTAPGPDRAAVLEEGAPLTGELRQDRADARLTALTAPGGDLVLVTALLDVGHTVTTDTGPVEIVRSGEFVLVPEGGTWKIDAFDMRTARDSR